MSSEENKTMIRRLYDELNKQDPTIIDALIDGSMATEFVVHSSQIQGKDDVKQAYKKALTEYADLHRTIKDIIAEGDKVWILEKDTWTDLSGTKMDATALTILRIVNGKAVEGWGGYLHNTS